MRNISAVEFVTLDGFVSGPDGEMEWVEKIYTDEIAQALGEGQHAVDTFLLGRITYQGLVSYWPEKTRAEEPFLADHINPKPKLVFSTTLESAPWGTYHNASVVKDHAFEEVHHLKQQAGLDMMIIGSPASCNVLQRRASWMSMSCMFIRCLSAAECPYSRSKSPSNWEKPGRFVTAS